MMLSYAGQRGEALRCKQLGIAAYLTKPVSSSDLLNSVLTALGTGVKNRKEPSLVTWNSLPEDQRRLQGPLAEANPANQMRTRRMLWKPAHTTPLASLLNKPLQLLDHPLRTI